MNETTKRMRKDIIRVSATKNAGHIPSSFSVLEILYSLYFNVLQELDDFVLSKGHASLGLYAVLLEKSYITRDDFDSFCSYDSKLGGHPDRNKIEKVYASTGSLGHGFPIAVGSALARKIQKKDGRIYCLVGDGECNEGTIWESALLANHLKLDNLVCIVDENLSQIRSVPTSSISEKFNSFGWETKEVNGHDIDAVTEVLKTRAGKPLCIVARTQKGHGVKDMANNMFAWHHRSPNPAELEDFLKELSE
jgi:transketolase